MVDKATIDHALKAFAEELPEKPNWVIALTYKGKFVGRFGEYEDEVRRLAREMTLNTLGNHKDAELLLAPLNDEKASQITYEYALATQKFNEQPKAERDTFVIALDGNHIIWFTFRFIIGIYYSNVAIPSYNRTLDSIYHNVAELHDRLAPVGEIWIEE